MASKQEEEQLNACLNIMRRMPPSKIDMNLSGLINLLPELTDDLLQRVDKPLELEVDTKSPGNKKFIKCDYNRDGDSYRSPWSNEFFPPIEDGFMPPDNLRELEIQANEVFDSYRHLYYEGGVSSVYFWELDDNSFAGCFLVKKDVTEKKRAVSSGCWDSIHVIEANTQGSECSYRLTTTVMLSMTVPNHEAGDVNLSGSLTRQMPKTCKLDNVNTHIVNMGKMIEEMEITLRKQLDDLYIQRTRHIVNSIRKPGQQVDGPSAGFMSDLTSAIGAHGAKVAAHNAARAAQKQ